MFYHSGDSRSLTRRCRLSLCPFGFLDDGCVSFREFIRVRSQDPIRFVFLVFDLLDQDKDGCLMIKDEMNEFYTIDNNRKYNLRFNISAPNMLYYRGISIKITALWRRGYLDPGYMIERY